MIATLVSSLLCFFVWVPNIVFQVPSPFWWLTFIIGPIGVAFGILAKNSLLVILNGLMFFSLFIFMAIGYIINSMM